MPWSQWGFMQNHEQRIVVGVGLPLVGEHQTTMSIACSVDSTSASTNRACCECKAYVFYSALWTWSTINCVLWRWMSGPGFVILATVTVFPKWCLAAVTNAAKFYVDNHWAVYWALHTAQWTYCLCHSVTGDYSTLFDSRPRRTPCNFITFPTMCLGRLCAWRSL